MLVRNTAVAMSDGGGGGGRTTFGLNQIPISDIEYYYNKGSGFTDDEMNLIKSSKKIDAEAVESARLELEEKITEIDTLFTTNYGVIDALLENSNSVLLAKGIDAQAQRENLASVRDTLHAALDR